MLKEIDSTITILTNGNYELQQAASHIL